MVSTLDAGIRLQETVDPVIEAIARTHPAYARLLRELDRELVSYIRGFSSTQPPAIQARTDFTEQAVACVRAAQGDVAAERMRTRLQDSPVLHTANHLCLETLPLTVQSMALAAFGEEPDGILPVDACGSIPADNVCFPTGILLARERDGKRLCLPILELSKRQRRQVTWLLEPFTGENLSKAAARVAELGGEGVISEREVEALSRFLELLAAPESLALPTYREQVSRVVPRLWDAWFTPEARRTMPALAYLPGESVRIPLLVSDLRESGSFASRILMDPPLREQVLIALEGLPGCWTDGGRSGGSVFFWRVDRDRRARPLALESGHLVATDGVRIPMEAGALVDALQEGSLLPTTFLSLSLGLARGLVQVGGFMQVEYLAAIRRGLRRSLAACGYQGWAERLSGQLPAMLTAGLTAAIVEYGDGSTRSAGSIELLARGGLAKPELERLRGLSVREALATELPAIARSLLGPTVSGWMPHPIMASERLLRFRL